MHTASTLISIPAKNSITPDANAQPADPLEGGASFSDVFADQTQDGQPETVTPDPTSQQDSADALLTAGFLPLQGQIQRAPTQKLSLSADNTQLASLTVGSTDIDPAALPISGIDTETATPGSQSEATLETFALDTIENQPVASPKATEALLKAAPDITLSGNQLAQTGQAPQQVSFAQQGQNASAGAPIPENTEVLDSLETSTSKLAADRPAQVTADPSSAPVLDNTGTPIGTPLAVSSIGQTGIAPTTAFLTPSTPQIGTATSAFGPPTAANQPASEALSAQTTGEVASIENAVSPTPINFASTADAPQSPLSAVVAIDAQSIDAVATDINASTTLGSANGAIATTTPQAALPTTPIVQNSPIIAKPNDIPVIISQSVANAEPGQDSLVIQLDPPELGRVTIDFKFDGQILNSITITGESPEALRQLRSMHFELIQTLEANGLSSKDLNFQQEKSPHDQFGASREEHVEGEDQADGSAHQAWQANTETPRKKSINSASGLNIKV